MAPASLPTIWLMTDERLGGLGADDMLWRALGRLPCGAGIVFRHYGLPEADRRALLKRVAAFARRRRLIVVGSMISGAPGGRHSPARSHRPASGQVRGLKTHSAHGRRELVQAFAHGADLVFLSPVFPTGSHPGGRALGPLRFGLAVRGAAGPVVALGGMDGVRARRLKALGADGYAGIACWTISAQAQ